MSLPVGPANAGASTRASRHHTTSATPSDADQTANNALRVNTFPRSPIRLRRISTPAASPMFYMMSSPSSSSASWRVPGTLTAHYHARHAASLASPSSALDHRGADAASDHTSKALLHGSVNDDLDNDDAAIVAGRLSLSGGPTPDFTTFLLPRASRHGANDDGNDNGDDFNATRSHSADLELGISDEKSCSDENINDDAYGVQDCNEGNSDIDEHSSLLTSHVGSKYSHHYNRRKHVALHHNVRLYTRQIARALPPLFLGLLLNLLDAVSYGAIIFPVGSAAGVFDAAFTVHGISMFLVSTVVSQFVYALGGSKFPGVNGSMMIEVIPFFHQICAQVATSASTKEAVVPTVLFLFVLSALLTGVVFFALGWLRAGAIVGFFPRPLLIGTIGGIGLFLIQTGIELASKLHWSWSVDFFRALFQSQTMPVWLSSCALTAVLQLLQRLIHHPLLLPAFFCAVPVLFYLITLVGLGVSIEELRRLAWVMAIDSGSDGADATQFYSFYMLWQWQLIDWAAVGSVIPTMLVLVFFGILHVPINLPALAISTGQEHLFDINRELMGHGVSNILSSLALSVQNYVVYSTSVLFIRLGGGTRLASLLLGTCTVLLLIFGVSLVNYIPTILVSSLILHLGVDLVRESIWDSYALMDKREFAVILAVMVAMLATDFTVGLACGGALSVLIFVIGYARTQATGPLQCQPGTEGRSVYTLPLLSALFFGNTYQVTRAVQEVTVAAEKHGSTSLTTILILDFSRATQLDFSFVTELSRLRRLLRDVGGLMVISGLSATQERTLVRGGLVIVSVDSASEIENYHDLLGCYCVDGGVESVQQWAARVLSE